LAVRNEYAFAQGMRATRATLERWNGAPGPVLAGWLALAVAIALSLIAAVWAFASTSTPDPTPFTIPGLEGPVGIENIIGVLYRNSLVLALHATACIAGFLAGASMPVAAAQRTGFSRWIHIKAGQFAIVFVTAVTLFSLTTQAYILGFQGATIADQLDITTGQLILTVLPHALPELIALFLPLAAWLIASRRGAWDELLAATFITVAIAIPVLVAASLVEVFLWGDLLRAVSPLV
jgi:hypothetical protein